MASKEFVEEVVRAHYQACKTDPTNYSKLWSAFQSMNTVAEQVALERFCYGNVTRQELEAKSEDVRQQFPELQPIKEGALMLRHVRRHVRGQVTASSTGISPSDPTTWVLQDGSTVYKLTDILDRAVAVLPTIPEIK